MNMCGASSRMSIETANFEQRSNGTIKVKDNFWLAGMTFWVQWTHCGLLTSETASDLVEMDAMKFAEVCSMMRGPLFSILQRIAILAVAHAEREVRMGELLTDLPFDEAVWKVLFLR